MNFFDAQDNARRLTRWLVIVYIVATLLIVAGVTATAAVALFGFGQAQFEPHPGLLAGIALGTLLVIVLSTLYRTARLASGGDRVAIEMGGIPVDAGVTDPLQRRYRNVVEEMAIASGVPVPDIYVLDRENGINAFAAGFSPDDAAIAVTRGALETLDRDELQGVVAHEFSHILNGDMRLNIRLMGVLFGIMVIGLIGRTILRGGSHGSYGGGRRGKGSGGIVIIGLGMAVLGWIGVFFARIIKAAVSRQREYLADASAVQFTRQTRGIAGALKKIGGYEAHSFFRAADAEQVSHMLFAVGARFSSLFSTHPPLADRIRALDPTFDGSPDSRVKTDQRAGGDISDGPGLFFTPGATDRIHLAPGAVIESIGQPAAGHVAYATALHQSIPEELIAPARSPDGAWLLVLALLVAPDVAVARRQFDLLRQQLGESRTAALRRYSAAAEELGPRYTLPLLEVAFPALRQSGEQARQFVLDLGRKLVEIDGNIDLREFCLFRILSRGLENAAEPSRSRKRRSPGPEATRTAGIALVRLLAERGSDSEAARQNAASAGLACFGHRSQDTDTAPDHRPDVVRFREALDELEGLRGRAAETVVKAATATVLADGTLTITESEMFRTLCASLGCPLPPLVATAEAHRR